MTNLFLLCFRDFFSKKFILWSLLPFIISVIVFIILIIFSGSELFDNLKQGNFSFLNKNGFFAYILSFQITKWFILTIFYASSALLSIILSTIIAMIISGFLTHMVCEFVNKKYYNFTITPQISMLETFKIMFLTFIKFILFLMICLPLLFIPIINLFIINLPFYYFFYKFMLIDVSSVCLTTTEFSLIMKKDGGWDFKFSALVFYILCLIPFAGLFFQLFFVMFFSHIIFRKSQIYKGLKS